MSTAIRNAESQGMERVLVLVQKYNKKVQIEININGKIEEKNIYNGK